MDRPRVLVIEDRPSVLKLMVSVLEGGYDVTTASEGATALSLIGSETFDVVLTDVRMPGATGFDVLRAIRNRAQGPQVVMMTAYANVADAVAAIKLGAYDYVAKPLDADEISLVVARAVERQRERAEGNRDGDAAEDEHLDGDSAEVSVGFHDAVEEARRRASRRYLMKLMRLFAGNVTQAAKRAGMTRESLHRVLKQYGVRSGPHRPLEVLTDEAQGGARSGLADPWRASGS